ncbi:uncharacterized protein JN550_012027 [Neoarthrinium moseri]|uniref:uncharacterized protein n=1 Tax=Neoarthrinium moseri TaxID=1658444 RepID=UPI001FDE6506|nr:uncharacterized protein JN550_012027 [Neoarthrinium moseri]KAI1859509.1 hypothetical protein JN550_012027 [Neoarthrinium moseri]
MSENSDPTVTSIGTWKVVLAVMIPLFVLAVVAALYFWHRHRCHQIKRKSEIERVGTMLDELQARSTNIEAMSYTFEAGVERVKKMETEMRVRENNWKQVYTRNNGTEVTSYSLPPPGPWVASPQSIPLTPTPHSGFHGKAPAGPRPLSGNTLQGGLPRSAPGLEYLSRTRSGSESEVARYTTRHPPSTIAEESSAGGGSPFDTPGRNHSPLLQRSDGSYVMLNAVHPPNAEDDATYPTAAELSPLRNNPSHPDLVPQPLQVIKRNSTVREQSTGNLTRALLRRSVSDATPGSGYIRAGLNGQIFTSYGRGQHRDAGPSPIPEASATAISPSKPQPENPFTTPRASTLAATSEPGSGTPATSPPQSTLNSPRRLRRPTIPFWQQDMEWRIVLQTTAECCLSSSHQSLDGATGPRSGPNDAVSVDLGKPSCPESNSTSDTKSTDREEVLKNKHRSLPVRARPLPPSPTKRRALSKIPRLASPCKSTSGKNKTSQHHQLSIRRDANHNSPTHCSYEHTQSDTRYKVPTMLCSSPAKKFSESYPSSQCLPGIKSPVKFQTVDAEEDEKKQNRVTSSDDILGRAAILKEMSEALRQLDEADEPR